MEHAFAVTNLEKRYDAFTLGPLDLDLEPGRVLGFIGPNGAGKTTTLRCLAGLVRPDGGAVQCLGHDPREADGAAWFGIRPEHVVVGEDANSADTKFSVTADVVEALGSDTLVLTTVNGKRFWLRISGQSQVASGDTLKIGLNAADASLFDKGDETRL